MVDDYDYDYDDDRSDLCHYCHGECYGIRGHDWENEDSINDPDGEIERCPCCNGTGKAEDCMFW